MPPPKIIGQSFARKKKYCERISKKKKERKNNKAKEKTKHFFVWNSGCLHNKVFPWGSPEGQKKNKVTFPVKFKLVPLVLLLYERKKKALPTTASPCSKKSYFLLIQTHREGLETIEENSFFCLNQVYKKNQCLLLLLWISVSKNVQLLIP